LQNNIAGKDISVTVLFEDDAGNLVVPDTGSVTYTLYGSAGTALASNVAVTAPLTQVSITILAALNAKTALYEQRTLVVTYKLSGATYTRTFMYRLVDFVPMSVTVDRVRAFIGVGRNELPDSDIDLYETYIQVVADIGQDLVTAALVGVGKVNLSVNLAITCQAVLQIMPGIRTRFLQSSKSNTASASRFASMDLEAVMADVQSMYEGACAGVTNTDLSQANAGVYLAVSSPPVDYVTGSAPVVPTA
jgi:hypothetical protein